MPSNQQHADYPGVIPYTRGKEFFDRELERDEKCVRGTLVFGLNHSDIEYLDWFEGGEYTREKVTAYQLEEAIPLSEYELNEKTIIPDHALPPLPQDLGEGVEAETYIYVDPSRLKRDLWSFEEFVKEKAWKWYGPEGGRQYEDDDTESD
ncbi:hypothetical protein AX16_002702 [Volvariella volvacea WC 439]|nr:hypothetical protein AX16_002702 [Volvariella volvacea WC 439]